MPENTKENDLSQDGERSRPVVAASGDAEASFTDLEFSVTNTQIDSIARTTGFANGALRIGSAKANRAKCAVVLAGDGGRSHQAPATLGPSPYDA
jgi:hypothetical protein